MKRIKLALILSVLVCVTFVARAEFSVTLKSTLSDAVSTLAARLYNQGAPAGPGVDPSEAGDPVWLVFDVDGGGVFQPGALTGITYDGTVADLLAKMIQPGDYVLQTTIPGPLEGRISRPFAGLPSVLQTGGAGANDAGGTVKPSVAILFDDANLSNGGMFGFDQTANGGLIQSVGNVDLRIGQDVYANTYTFSTGTVAPPQPTLSNTVAQVTSSNVILGFSFLTTAGASYQIQSTTNLAPPIAWSNELPAIPGTGSVTNLFVTNGPPLIPEKFFRVQAN